MSTQTMDTTSNNPGIFVGERGVTQEHLEDYQFPVAEFPVHVEVADGLSLEVPHRRAILRTDTDTVLGTVGRNYQLLSHADALDPLLQQLEGRGEKIFKRVALTADGARMFANIYFPDQESTITGEDSFWPGISVVNSLDGSLKYHLEATIYRLVCTNGMRVPEVIAGGSAIHSKKKDFSAMVDNIMGFVGDKTKFDIFRKWASKTINEDKVELMIDSLLTDESCKFPKAYRDQVVREAHDEAKFGVISIWSLYNAFNSVLEHGLVRSQGKYDRARSLDENVYKLFMARADTLVVA